MSIKPEVFGKYILLDKIATGGMAEVYLAKSLGAENVSKFLALKRILPQFSKNAEFINMFKEEAKIAINLTHSNIVSMFEFGEVDGQFYLAMEYVEGRNLRQILNRFNKTEHYFTLQDIVYIIKEAAGGLGHAHRYVDGVTGKPLNITHRDISPQNIMVSFEGEIKIVDFGIAKAESKLEHTRAGTLKGKFGYMSPEQAEGLEVDYRTDIFSLGIVLWELLARDRLFLANNEMNTLKKIREARVPSLRKIDPSIPEELEKIVNKALLRDRETRYQATSDLFKDLSRFLNRHYPDFDTEEVAAKVKSLYEKERKKLKDNMIVFSRIQLTDFDEKTQMAVLENVTDTKSILSSSRILNNTQKRERVAPQALLSDDEIKKRTANLDIKVSEASGLLTKEVTLSDRKYRRRGTPHTSANHKALQRSGADPFGGFNDNNSDTYRSSAPPIFPKKKSLPIGQIIGVVFAASLVTFGIKSFMSGSLKQTIMNVAEVIVPSDSVEQATVSQDMTPSFHKLIVISKPAGAAITINGVPSKQYTPSQVTVPANQPITVTLTKDGHQKYQASHTITEDGQALEVSLVKLKVGYLNIKVKPAAAAEVKVNGKTLTGYPPFSRVPVPANSPVTVEVYDRVSNGSARDVYYIKENNEKDVVLFLKKRLPSSR